MRPAHPRDDAARWSFFLLPGAITSMREGSERACINDTIALRRPNGWEQGLENDAPLRCRASSP